MSVNGEAALRYAGDMGWHVFPVGEDCKPGRLHWKGAGSGTDQIAVYDSTTDAKQIAAYWERYPNANISLATGLVSGVFVIDIDVHDPKLNGYKTLDNLTFAHGELPDTSFVDTPSGGRHLYFRNPDRPLRNKVNFRPGLDVRASGAAVPLPPSFKPSGKYVTEGLSVFADAPEWLLDVIDPPQPIIPARPIAIQSSVRTTRYIEAAVNSEKIRVINTPPNTGRNNQLFISTASLSSIAAAGLLNDDDVRAVMMEAASLCGLVRDDGMHAVMATIESGLRAGRNNPREVSFGRS